MGCMSVFWTGLKGFSFLLLLISVIIVVLILCMLIFVFYMNFLATSPLWITLIGLAIPIIFFVGYYTRLYQWTVIKAEEYEKENS